MHKQDWFISERYKPELQKDDLSFLDRSFERHFNERPYLSHRCYLFLTKTTKERARQQSNFSTLCRGRLIFGRGYCEQFRQSYLEGDGNVGVLADDAAVFHGENRQLCLIGGIKVYSKWSSGDPDTSKTAASWFGACIFLIVAATILRSFFL